MTSRLEVYRCEICGNMVEVLHSGGGTLVCCGKPMTHLEEGVTDAATEKHVPVIKKSGDTVTVTIGEVLHPMEEKHYIEFIELIADGSVYRKFLKPGDAPKAVFKVTADKLFAREFCNLHGLWKA
ncbi:MAG: desulfoferrodoxin [Candidatus Eisenbacteria bacterium]|uniref:Desulfoferrodoxin n=1 Tax=Eiseniibacteriota bacterium TaxID=2212470 RepID=A0A948RYH4_UNCEI|nr:desulfoferrodoxin [Candidatus Eisenbacteria bacterium]MBU1949942.1 desulfoferrodoxin [Candidatus Eisenbacteria bacterium]MBU2692766.1 desulfoferrodoxin [Candidatus Eisenbacteria bacterium]